LRNLTQDNITQAVIARLAETPDARLREVMTSLVQHLHGFARDVKLTEQEWAAGVRLLAEASRESDDKGVMQLSDTLGLTMLTVAMHNGKPPGCTQAVEGEPGLVRGRVLSPAGTPLAGAVVDVAQSGVLRAGPDGRFEIRREPADDQPWRPDRLRFTVDADGYEQLVSDVFSSRDDSDCALEYDFVLSATKADP